jgi:hypothetical protein
VSHVARLEGIDQKIQGIVALFEETQKSGKETDGAILQAIKDVPGGLTPALREQLARLSSIDGHIGRVETSLNSVPLSKTQNTPPSPQPRRENESQPFVPSRTPAFTPEHTGGDPFAHGRAESRWQSPQPSGGPQSGSQDPIGKPAWSEAGSQWQRPQTSGSPPNESRQVESEFQSPQPSTGQRFTPRQVESQFQSPQPSTGQPSTPHQVESQFQLPQPSTGQPFTPHKVDSLFQPPQPSTDQLFTPRQVESQWQPPQPSGGQPFAPSQTETQARPSVQGWAEPRKERRDRDSFWRWPWAGRTKRRHDQQQDQETDRES